MSGNALYSRDFYHTIQDDLESLFYVTMYGSVRWLPHNYVSRMGPWMHSFFDEVSLSANGRTIGGENKLDHINFSGKKFLELFSFENRYVQMWFDGGYRLLGTVSETSQRRGQARLWNVETLHKLLAIICEGLKTTDDTGQDRTEHELEAYTGWVAGSRDTRISLLAGARNFRIMHAEPGSSRKRSSDVAFADAIETVGSKLRESGQGDDKRRRIGGQRVDAIESDGRTSGRSKSPECIGGERRSVRERALMRRNASGARISRSRGEWSRSLSLQVLRRSSRLHTRHSLIKSLPTR